MVGLGGVTATAGGTPTEVTLTADNAGVAFKPT